MMSSEIASPRSESEALWCGARNDKSICFIDFDATITKQDTLVVLLDHLAGRKNWKPIEEKIRAGRMTNIDGLKAEMNLCQIDPKGLVKLLQERVEIDPAFENFIQFAKRKKLELVILSGGFAECIEAIFEKYKIHLPYFANELIFGQAYLDVRYPYEKHTCGNCSHCKAFHLRRYKRRGFKTVFIGNGTTDRCPAKVADILFAKDSLAKFCRKEKIPFFPFRDFSNVEETLQKM